MKIISWNCNMKFREKFKELPDADIYVIQECENPIISKSNDYKEFSKNSIWIGDNKNKGLGIFAKPNILIDKKGWPSYCLKYFLPVSINSKFNILGVWARNPYIEEYYIYQYINKINYDLNTIIIGDFNSNAIWDKEHHERSHAAVVKELEEKGLYSIYHYCYEEKQGEESKNTFYLYRHIDKGYHIDHCFANPNIVQSYNILDCDKWLNYSDHIPIIFDFEL